MGYGDYTPPSGGRPKPLTKKQLAKARETYAKADKIAREVKEAESREMKEIEKSAEDELHLIL